MTASEFRRLVHNGHGRAIVYASKHDVSAFRDVILDACLHCYSVDSQTEGTRAAYMMDLLHTLPERKALIEAVLQSLAGCGDDSDAVQRFRFAAYIAADGHPGAKGRMYEAFTPGPRHGEEIAGEFVGLDGLDGFLFGAAKVGELLLGEQANRVDFGYLISRGRSALGEDVVARALVESGARDPCIEAFRLQAEADDAAWRGQVIPKPPEDDLAALALQLETATDADSQRMILGKFFNRPFPGNPRLVLDLAKSTERRLAHAATVVLAQVMHPEVRELAFRLIESRSPSRTFAIALLDRNFAPGDHRIALEWYRAEKDRYVLHSLGRDLMDLWKHHPDAESEPGMLRECYERGPCSFCRVRVVRRLAALNLLTPEWREECEWDAGNPLHSDNAG